MQARPPTFRNWPRLSFGAGAPVQGQRALPEEVAVALSYNGSTHAVMMATPADLIDFERGFTLTEGIASLDEIERIEPVETRPRHLDQLELRPLEQPGIELWSDRGNDQGICWF